MTSRIHAAEIRAAVIADFTDSGDTVAVVADRHGVARSTVGTWTAGIRDGGLGLTGGNWVPNGRGVQVWQPSRHFDRNRPPAEIRARAEEDMFTEAEGRQAHAKYAAGFRDARTVVGERVYQRRQKREQRDRKVAA